MTELVPRETVYEQIPDVIQQLRFEADERVEFVTADLGVEHEPEEEVVMAGYFRHLRTILPVAAHEVLEDIEAICEERRQLAVQRSMHHWLHGWLYVHVPLSFAFLVLILVHAVVSLRY